MLDGKSAEPSPSPSPMEINLAGKLEVLRHRVDQLEANRPKAESDAAD